MHDQKHLCVRVRVRVHVSSNGPLFRSVSYSVVYRISGLSGEESLTYYGFLFLISCVCVKRGEWEAC